MKLKKYLATLEDDTLIAIGSKSNYIYFGTKNDISAIKDRFDEYYIKVKESLDVYNKRLSYLERVVVKIGPKWSTDEINDAITKHAEWVYQTICDIHDCEAYLKEYKNPFDREVIESFNKEVDSCKRIIISGSERGNFWSKEEYDKKFNKEAWIKEEYDTKFNKKYLNK